MLMYVLVFEVRMNREMSLLAGQQLKASFAGYEIISDQGFDVDGKDEYPEPFDYFLASMLCLLRFICASFVSNVIFAQ